MGPGREGRAVAARRAVEVGAEHLRLRQQPFGLVGLAPAPVALGRRPQLPDLGAHDRLHLCIRQDPPLDLPGAKAGQRARELRMGGDRRRMPRRLHRLRVVDRRQPGPQGRHSDRVPRPHRPGKRTPQPLPHVPRSDLHHPVLRQDHAARPKRCAEQPRR